MRKSKILLGGILTLLVLVGLYVGTTYSFDEKPESRYTARETGEIFPNIADAQFDYFKQFMRNQQTGQYDPAEYKRALAIVRKFDAENTANRATSIFWEEKGPDNIGGRTRAILIDVNNNSHVFAGSVSGGLFESFNAGNTWTKVEGFSSYLSVSSIAQATVSPYKILVGTEHIRERERFVGNGVYESNDNGITWDSIPNTTSYNHINEIVYGPTQNKFYMTTSNGLKELAGDAPLGTGVATVTGTDAPTNPSECEGLAISPDGRVIVLGQFIAGTRTYVSNDYGASWTNVGGSAAGRVPQGSNRIEYAVSHTMVNGKYYTYAVGSTGPGGGTLVGAWVSVSDGDDGTWVQIAGSSSPSFMPFSTGSSAQGAYNNIMGVSPLNPGLAFVGGIDNYIWLQNTAISPPDGQWEQVSQWFLPPENAYYVHADNHEFKWDDNGTLYIGNDGGVGKSFNAKNGIGMTFYPSNKGYNVTQFYGIGFSAHGEVMGGTQDNGTLYNDYTNSTFMEFVEVRGGDGFDCDISFLYRDVMFSSIYFGGVLRSNDKGNNWGTFFSPAMMACGSPGALSGGFGQFNTIGRLWETPNDPNSTDSVIYIPNQAYSIGDTVYANGLSNDNTIMHILTQNLDYVDTLYPVADSIIAGDTLHIFINPNTNDTIDIKSADYMVGVALDTLLVQDPVQSWYAIANTGGSGCEGVWITRNALRFGASENFWWHVDINYGSGETPVAVEFSADGDIMYVSTSANFGSSGNLYRVSGLGALYGNDYDTGYATNQADLLPSFVSGPTLIHTASSPISGIGIDPNDKDHVVISVGGFGGINVYETNDATTSASFFSIQGNLPNIPAHDVVIDRADPNLIILGTEFGVYATDNGGSTWTKNANGMGNVPVYALRQNWRGFDEGSFRPGELYAGTHGRGIWTSTTYLGTPDDIQHNRFDKNYISDLLVYPNPMESEGTVSFELYDRADVMVTVYSITGKKVREINPGSMGTG